MYDRFQENRRIEISVEYTAKLEAKQEKAVEMAKIMIANDEPTDKIILYTGLMVEHIEELRSTKE